MTHPTADSEMEQLSPDELTWREQEVLALLAERMTNKEIAGQLHLAETTVKDYVGRILGKLHVKNRRQAVERAGALGLLEISPSPPARPHHNLPAQATLFIGRDDELAMIDSLFETSQLVTLTGPGGMGKTRLSIQFGSAQLEGYANGVFFIGLAPVPSVDQIVPAITEAIGFPLSTDEPPRDQLLRYLHGKAMFLIMDNFEHLIDGAEIVSAILEGAPDTRIIATSREKLNLRGETMFRVDGLRLPEEVVSSDLMAHDSLRLLVESVRRVRPTFSPSSDNVPTLLRICQMVQGMPLAIEIAGAWCDVLSLQEIADEIEQNILTLESEWQDIPERHRSIRAVFDHSWSLMSEEEQDVFAQLSVFRGGFTRHAVQAITGTSLSTLSGLVNKSLIRHNPDSGRFEIHELLRQYAGEKLAESYKKEDVIRHAHAEYFASFMSERWEHLRDRRQVDALQAIEADLDNVRTAWTYSLQVAKVEHLRQFLDSFWLVYWVFGWNHTAIETFGEAVTRLEGLPDNRETKAVRLLAMAYQAFFMTWVGQMEEGLRRAQVCVDLLDEDSGFEVQVAAQNSLHMNAHYSSHNEEERESAHRLLELSTEKGDQWWIAYANFILSITHFFDGNRDRVYEFASKSVQSFEEIGDSIGLSLAYSILGHLNSSEDNLEGAEGNYQRYYDSASRLNFRWAMANALKYLGSTSIMLSDLAQGRGQLQHGLQIALDIGNLREVINIIIEFARLYSLQNDHPEAVSLCAFVTQHPVSLQLWREEPIRDHVGDLLDELATHLTADAYTNAVQRGESLRLEDVVRSLLHSES